MCLINTSTAEYCCHCVLYNIHLLYALCICCNMYRGLTKYSYPDLQLEINVNRTGNVLNKLESILCWGCLMPIYGYDVRNI